LTSQSAEIEAGCNVSLIRGGRVIDPENRIDQVADLLLSEGKVVQIGAKQPNLPSGKMGVVIDATGLLVVPGLIDMHVHLREPGFEHKETIQTGTRAAMIGGFTSVACMANTNPTADSAETIAWVRAKAEAEGAVDVYPIGTITRNLEGKVKSDWNALLEAGAVALSDDGKTVMDTAIMRDVFSHSAKGGFPIIDHCEDHHLTADTVMNLGAVSQRLGLPGQPNASEDIIIARDILLAEQTGGHAHIAHISTEGGVDLIRWAKRRGVNVTTEACGHHFTITEAEVEKHGTNAKMHPPLRTQKDVEAVKQGLADGTIDTIVTDHAPHAHFEKNPPGADDSIQQSMMAAPAGIIGLETSLPLALTQLKDLLAPSEIIAKMTCIPAQILGIERGTLSSGAVADVTLIDSNLTQTVEPDTFASKSRNTPFTGWKLTGWPVATIRAGQLAWAADHIWSLVEETDQSESQGNQLLSRRGDRP